MSKRPTWWFQINSQAELMCVCDPTHILTSKLWKRVSHLCHVIWPQGGYDLLEFKDSFSMLISFCPYKQQNNLFNWFRFSRYSRDAQHYKLFSEHISDRIRSGITLFLISSNIMSVTLMWMLTCMLTQLQERRTISTACLHDSLSATVTSLLSLSHTTDRQPE